MKSSAALDTRRCGVLAGGNWIVDRVKIVDAWPAQDALATILSESSGNGGAPYNLLKDLAKLRAPFPLEAVGLVGADPEGRAILADCRANGIRTAQLRIARTAATGTTEVMTVKGTGRRTFFHRRGANARLDLRHFDFGRTRAKFFHLGYLLLLDRLDEIHGGIPRAAQLLRRAQAAGLRTSIDCVSEDSPRFRSVVAPVLPHVDVLFANDFEAERITGLSLGRAGALRPSSVVRAGRRLLAAGVRSWVIVHMPEAVCACSREGAAIWQPSVRVPRPMIAGSAGAGDALAAGVLFGLHEEWPMEECLELGVSAAAASLSHPSCSDGMLPAQTCLSLARRLGYRRLPAGRGGSRQPAAASSPSRAAQIQIYSSPTP